MAYDQRGQYAGAPARGYYDQQAPRGAPRNVPRPAQRGPQPYADEYNGYAQEGAQHQYQDQHESYQGYDRDSFWGAYGGDTSGYDQQYEQDYGHQQQYNQGYNNQPQQRRGPPPQSRGQMPRGDEYGPPRPRGYSNGTGGQMRPGPGPGPGPGSRGRGPPQNYAPQNYGPPRGGMQQYDDRRQMGGPQGGPSPPRQKREWFQFCLFLDECDR
jgi:hypothetical protein